MRLNILALLLFFINILTAAQVSYEQAQTAVLHHLRINEKEEFSISGYFKIQKSNEITSAYVFNLELD